jgi:hypothetical protein
MYNEDEVASCVGTLSFYSENELNENEKKIILKIIDSYDQFVAKLVEYDNQEHVVTFSGCGAVKDLNDAAVSLQQRACNILKEKKYVSVKLTR